MSLFSTRTVLVMAGGTGGHIFPALAVADELKARGWSVIWLGAAGGMETRLVPQYGYPLETLAIRGMRGNGLMRWLTLPWMMTRALGKTLGLMLRYRPRLALGFGGYTGFPGGVMARFLWLPLVIHEQNAVAGLTNRLLARIATRTLYAFPGAFADARGCVGNPVRTAISALPAPEQRYAARDGQLKVLVVGGSLGAKVFNDIIPEALARIPEAERPQVLHQAGVKQIDALVQNYQRVGVQADTRAFIDDMAQAYAEADLVICRAGALTVAELACAGVASLLIPLPQAVDDHQTANARFLAQQGAAQLMPQAEFNVDTLAIWLSQLTRVQCLLMAQHARILGQPHAACAVADVCEEVTK